MLGLLWVSEYLDIHGFDYKNRVWIIVSDEIFFFIFFFNKWKE